VRRGRETGAVNPQTLARLEDGVDEIRRSPREIGRIELIVRRPAVDQRDVLEEATLDAVVGLVGDTWLDRRSTSSVDGKAHPEKQLNLMNARVAALVAGPIERWALAGDQFFVDFDISHEALPAGTRLQMGSAVIEITPSPHRGCAKFAARFGDDALKFVNSPVGSALRMRGVCAKVVTGGTVRAGDTITRVNET
jgi:MOSC domain-containing protein YiiM